MFKNPLSIDRQVKTKERKLKWWLCAQSNKRTVLERHMKCDHTTQEPSKSIVNFAQRILKNPHSHLEVIGALWRAVCKLGQRGGRTHPSRQRGPGSAYTTTGGPVLEPEHSGTRSGTQP